MRWLAVGVLMAALGVFASFCLVILDEREIALRTLFGDPELSVFGIPLNRPVLDEPGVYVSIPGVHALYRYDRRALRFDAEPRELNLAENYRLVVDYYLVYRIIDPRKMRQVFGTTKRLTELLDDTAFSEVRDVLAQHAFEDLLSDKRSEITDEIARRSGEKLARGGIEVIDFRIRRTDHPEANRARIFDRMRAERERFAKRYRAEGDEQARRVRSDADRQSVVLRAEGEREGLRARGEGDAEAARIYGEAYGQDREFYAFVRSLRAYETALDSDTTLILSPDSAFLKYLFDVTPPGVSARPPSP
ncbi:MAG: protease modulator HflC [Deltaproteobacteria bacterium]|nr:protease modulator HflC [Deltaproteobacteria bacterium]MBW2414344.1 protease modulator HflC [Deltaproteobacteria bacterium]